VNSESIGKTKLFYLLLALVFLILLGSEVLFQMGVRTQYYAWEFKFDLKTIAIGVLCYVINRKFNVGFEIRKIGLWSWSWRDNLLAFFSPLLLFTTLIAAALIVKAATYQGADNPTTFLLATIFDVPATLFFSIFVVLLEEILFRGFMFNAISNERRFFISALLVSCLWGVYSLGDLLHNQDSGIVSVLSGFINSLSIGLVCSAFLLYSKSIWVSYSFRIGLLTFSAALLSRGQEESNTFFVTNFASFSSSGIVLSFLNFVLAAILLKLSKISQTAFEIK